ncbi:NDR1/HIN1-like protein 6 [Abrus precatorius]|uniref:NDR1/HIN1-like protein 6 n=1 Tax=Abrus precatorius TaxID=3816 RepID=A0A8B8JWK7_ABRPR|nr:NDR1/HIN1-like protein 6 [Abrus precatorius]
MTDRVHPSAKPTANGGGATTNPPTKSQLYGATRPTYRPPPHHRRSSRGFCCSLCLCLFLTLLSLLLLLGGAATLLYFLYRPHPPSFSLTSLNLSSLNLTSSSTLTSNFNLTLSTTNPNNKIIFFYHPTTVSILSGDLAVAQGTIPSFQHREKNTTLLQASVASIDEAVESDVAMELKQSLKSKNGLALKVELETKVEAKMGVLKTPRVGLRVLCDGIDVTLPAGEKPAMASTANTQCKVDVRFKLWKWTLG